MDNTDEFKTAPIQDEINSLNESRSESSFNSGVNHRSRRSRSNDETHQLIESTVNYKIIVPATEHRSFDDDATLKGEVLLHETSSSEDDYEQGTIQDTNSHNINQRIYYVRKDWTHEEEARVRWKADLIIMPLLTIAFLALQLDRTNISNALTDTFEADLGIGQNQVNVGNQLLYVGVVMGEIPSNYFLQRIGPRTWLSFQILLWGTVSLCQAFIQNYAQYLATRVLLGFAESGFICAGLFCLSCWFKKNELGPRHTIYFMGNFFASCIGGYIAGGILKIGKVSSWAGWRWLFLVEGLFTLFIGVIFFLLFPRSTRSTKPYFCKKWEMFSERERLILTNRLLLDDPIKALHLNDAMCWKDVVTGLKKWRPWVHGIISMLCLGPFAAFNTYYPSIIKSLGYTQFQANAMSSVGFWLAAAAALFFSYFIRRFRPFGASALFLCAYSMIFAIIYRSIVTYASGGTKYAVYTLLEGSYLVIHVINTYWLSVNCLTQTDRGVALALIIMLVNLGSVYGNQLFRSEDSPHYQKGFLAAILLFAAAFIITLALMLQYYWKNKQLDKKYLYIKKDDADEEEVDKTMGKDEEGNLVIDFTTRNGVNEEEFYNTFRYSP